MPEGPSILILKEAVQFFKGERITEVSGNTKVNKDLLLNQVIIDFKIWGKHFLICTQKINVRIHLMLWGSYRINEEADTKPNPRLCLKFEKGILCFYACSVKMIEESLDNLYDWSADVLSDSWNAASARKKLKMQPKTQVCDALLDQQIFSGVGNIIKNEVLFRIKVHPETETGMLPPKKLTELINEARNYSFDFLKWKREFVLAKHWLAHTKKTCVRCNIPIIKKYCGETQRRTFFCENCQVKYK